MILYYMFNRVFVELFIRYVTIYIYAKTAYWKEFNEIRKMAIGFWFLVREREKV